MPMLKTIEPDSSIAPFKYFVLKIVSLKYLYIAMIILCVACCGIIQYVFNKGL